MSRIREIDGPDFASQVLQAERPVLVDFSAVWCGPCKMLEPVVEELAAEWDGKMEVVKIDVDHNPDVAGMFMVMGVPTLLLFKEGKPVERLVGYQPKERIVKKLSPHLE